MDDFFKDFTFPSSPNPTQNSNKLDDEWGDFIESPIGSSSKPQENPQSVHPFGFSKNPSFVKPKGALPLSLFGDLEKEDDYDDEKEEEKESDVGFKKELNFQVGVGINDIIANLYTQSNQIKPQNGIILEEIHKENGNEFSFTSNGVNLDKEIQKGNGFLSNLNKFDSSLTSYTNGGNEFDGDDEDGWEFKDASAELNDRDGSDNKGSAVSELSGLEWISKSATGQEMQVVDFKAQEKSKVTTFSSHNGSGSAGPKNVFATSNGTSAKSHQMDFGFDFKLSAAAENSFFADSYFQGVHNSSENGYGNSDEGFGDFKDGSLESIMKQTVDLEGQDTSKATAYSSVSNGLPGPIDLFAVSDGTSAKSHATDNGFDFKSSTVSENSFLADTFFQSEQNGTDNGLNPHSHVPINDSDGNFGGFKAGFLGTASKKKEPKLSSSSSEFKTLTFDGKNQGNETRSEKHKGPVPLSIFGDEEHETESSLNMENGFLFKGSSPPGNIQTQTSNLSITDLLSNLYSQVEPVSSFDSMQKPTDNGLVLTNGVSDTDIMGDEEEDFDDGSWEFKDAVSQTGDKEHMSLNLQDAHQNGPSETKQNDYVDFYRKLKDQLCLVARHHLDNLKEARKNAALSGEEILVGTLDDEIQEARKELHEEEFIISNEDISEDFLARNNSLNEFVEVLHEVKFQVLESEYHLSTRLSTAEKELRSTVELIKHARAVLKILRLVSFEEQSYYLSTCSKMLSVCTQELKHGAWIWKQSLEKNVQTQILSQPQGRRFILALGEIYRVVAILEASVKVYKPWILSNSENFTAMDALLEESHTHWSTLGLEEALPTISHLLGSEYQNNVETLLESIKQIRNLDAFALGICAFAQQESLCRLSVLTPGVAPDVKIVEWDGEEYFLPLANLWANMISNDPPKLLSLHVG